MSYYKSFFSFRINKKIPRGPPSPPAPVMHSPTRKVTVKEQQEWRIPPCVSNWKNAKGGTRRKGVVERFEGTKAGSL